MVRALGANIESWILNSPESGQREAEGEIPAVDVSSHADEGHGKIVAVLLSAAVLCLLFWPLHRTAAPSPAVELAPAVEASSSAVVSPQVRLEKTTVERSLPGLVVANKTVDVKAERAGYFTARRKSGDRVVLGQAIGEYDLTEDDRHCAEEPAECRFEPAGDLSVTAPITGTIINAVPESDTEVVKGGLLFQVAADAALAIEVASAPPGIDREQFCDIWKATAFLSYAEILPDRQRGRHHGLSLRPLDPFALIGPGMTVSVRCAQVSMSKRLYVPENALVSSDRGPHVAVVGTGGSVALQRVTVGRMEGGDVEIVRGLSSQMRLYSNGEDYLRRQPAARPAVTAHNNHL